MVWIHCQARMRAGAPQRLGRASPRGAGAAAAGERPDEQPTTIKVKDGGFASVERGAGLRPASWSGTGPLTERTVAGTGALRRNGDFVRRSVRNVGGGRRGAGALRFGRLHLFSSPSRGSVLSPAPIPRGALDRRSRAGVLLHSRGQVSDQMGRSELPSYARPQVAIRHAAVKGAAGERPAKAGDGAGLAAGRGPPLLEPYAHRAELPDSRRTPKRTRYSMPPSRPPTAGQPTSPTTTPSASC